MHRLVRRAKQLVTVDTVVCDREFDSMNVFQTLSNLNVNYLIPKRTMQTEATVLEQMEADSEDVAVETAQVDVEHGSHEMRFCYVPTSSEDSDGTAVFATNVAVSATDAEGFCRRYSDRWQIENEYKTIKHDFLATTSSKDYRVRSFYFVFAVLLYNLWRLTDLLLKARVSTEIVDFSPYLTAGEFVDYVAKYLWPVD
ncbi:transposase [Natrialba taiwanensis]|uniref:transposase n=1 Tax=Natrialba taiwanensis TaxID=160846 RepID=UPI001EF9F55A